MGWDDRMRLMRDLKTIDQVHVRAGDGWRRWDGMIRWEIVKQLTKFTYSLETDEEDGMGWLDAKFWNNWPSSRTGWRRMEKMGCNDQTRYLKTIDQVHVLAGDGWRGWDGMIRWEILKQLTTYSTGKHYEDVPELHNTMVPRTVPNLDDFILRTESSFASPTEITQIQ